MGYKKQKKTLPLKATHLISYDLIKNKRFEDIIALVQGKAEISNRDRYSYGYALLMTQQALASLLLLWPLAKKGPSAILNASAIFNDCVAIATHVVNDERLFSSTPLSRETLYTLLQASTHLLPDHPATQIIKQRYFELLWLSQDYEALDHVLKTSSEKFSGFIVENLSKLDFFQPERKLNANTAAFISHVLTGGACLIGRNALYHDEIPNLLPALGQELKLLFSQLTLRNKQTFAFSQVLFDQVVDHEVRVLIDVLKLAVKDKATPFDIIPSPNYLLNYDSNTRRIGETFLPWLATQDKDLVDFYQADACRAIFLSLSAEKSAGLNEIIKLVKKTPLHPLLRFALMLRAECIRPSSLQGLVKIDEFTYKDNMTSNLLKQIVLQIVKSIVHGASSLPFPLSAWLMVVNFYPQLGIPELKHIILIKSIQRLQHNEKMHVNLDLDLDLDGLKQLTNQFDGHEIKTAVDSLCDRQAICSRFLEMIETKSKSSKCIAGIKNQLALREHLTLIADSLYLANPEPTPAFFKHMKDLTRNKKINLLIPLQDHVRANLGCQCIDCQTQFCKHDVPHLIEALNLPVARLPDESVYSTKANEIPAVSILLQDDPFKTLGVSFTDLKPVIMKKVMLSIQQSPEKMPLFRQAQNELFHLEKRFVHHYLRALAYTTHSTHTASSASELSAHHEIPFRQDYYNACN